MDEGSFKRKIDSNQIGVIIIIALIILIVLAVIYKDSINAFLNQMWNKIIGEADYIDGSGDLFL